MKKLALLLVISNLLACGFASDDIYNNTDITVEGKTKYKKIYVGACGYRIEVQAYIDDDYGHWRKNMHGMSAMYGANERAEYSTWDTLAVTVPCQACLEGVSGMISVLDSKAHWMPWGCGQERPPLNVYGVTATFVDKKGAVDLEDEANASWQDSPYPVYKHSFVPDVFSSEKFIGGDIPPINLFLKVNRYYFYLLGEIRCINYYQQS